MINRSKICWDRNEETLVKGGGTQFMKTQGKKIEGGESKFSPTGRGETTPLDTMILCFVPNLIFLEKNLYPTKMNLES